MTNQDLPYLKELESVDTSGSGRETMVVLGMCSMLLPILAMFGYGYWRFHEYFEPEQRALIAVIPALIVLLLIRWLSTFSRVATSPEGITLSGVLRRRLIPWGSILRAGSKQTSIGMTIITLDTNRGRVRLDTGGMSGSTVATARIAASVWQHLRRNGIQNDVSLSERDRSFWQEIGEDVPHEIRWTGGNPKPDLAGGIVLGAILIFAVVLMLSGSTFSAKSLAMLSFVLPPLCMLIYLGVPELLSKAYSVHVNDTRLEVVSMLGQHRIPWDRVVRAEWRNGLILRWHDASRKGIVNIPYCMGKTESEAMILAIIRNLRRSSNPPAIPLPELAVRHPESLRKATSNSHVQTAMKRAYLNTLEPGLRRRISRLYFLTFGSVFLGIIAPIAAAAPDPLARLSRALHGDGARYFFALDSIVMGIPLFFAAILAFALLGEWAADRLAGPDRQAWEEFKKVAPTSKSADLFVKVTCSIAGMFLLLTPFVVDSYISITDRGMVFSRFWDMKQESHDWSEVKRVAAYTYQVRDHGREDIRLRYRVFFSDGTSIPLDDTHGVWRNGRQLPDAMEFICRQSGVQMRSR